LLEANISPARFRRLPSSIQLTLAAPVFACSHWSAAVLFCAYFSFRLQPAKPATRSATKRIRSVFIRAIVERKASLCHSPMQWQFLLSLRCGGRLIVRRLFSAIVPSRFPDLRLGLCCHLASARNKDRS
jgi:hypothetical protein